MNNSWKVQKSSLIHLNFSMYLKKNLRTSELSRDCGGIILQKLLIYSVFVVSPLFFGLQNASLNEDSDMMADGGLRQVNHT